jgi:hypothetical protein
VKGYCIGGHHHLAYHCDFTIAADTAIFGQNGPRVGSPAHGRSVAQLAHIIGVKRAKEFWMLCRQYTAQQAYEMGLANAVVPIERLDEEVDQWCDELLDLAVKGQLKTPAVLERQVRRMLGDPRSEALTKSFASFYLWIRNVADQQVDSDDFPNFDQTLRQAMAKETELFFDSVRTEDRSILTLLDADYTFLNERLAQHYGIDTVRGPDFRRVPLAADSPRRGILGKASILLVTSEPRRTSPVKRGKWILDNVLGTPPPPPPPNVPLLGETQKQPDGRVLSLREMMAKHRNNPVCAGCHNVIDPVGFALEQFDASGKWREVDRSFTRIDPAGMMPDGSKFASLAEFRRLLTDNPGPFLRTFTEKLLTYALGRPNESYDAPAVRKILRDAAKDNYKFSSVVLGVIKSTPFQMRQAPDAAMVAAR